MACIPCIASYKILKGEDIDDAFSYSTVRFITIRGVLAVFRINIVFGELTDAVDRKLGCLHMVFFWGIAAYLLYAILNDHRYVERQVGD